MFHSILTSLDRTYPVGSCCSQGIKVEFTVDPPTTTGTTPFTVWTLQLLPEIWSISRIGLARCTTDVHMSTQAFAHSGLNERSLWRADTENHSATQTPAPCLISKGCDSSWSFSIRRRVMAVPDTGSAITAPGSKQHIEGNVPQPS
jgi:hypothetical protein